MHTERTSRWTPRRIAGGVLRRSRAVLSRAQAGVATGWEWTALRLDASTPESLVFRLALLGLSRRSLVGSGPAVSLTSYGARIADVHLTIESIARGSLKPSALFLWLDDPDVVSNPPRPLRRLIRRGLSLRLCTDYGPHKKYYPYLLLDPVPGGPLVTADDDVLYPPRWLAGLADARATAPDLIHCYRARRVTFDGDRFAPYLDWPRSHNSAASPLNFSTGVSGAIYPPEFLQVLRELGDAFLATCPRADDVWLHRTAVEFGFDVHQILDADEHEHFPVIPGSQELTLMTPNVLKGENDRQIEATYTPANIARLRAVAVSLGEV